MNIKLFFIFIIYSVINLPVHSQLDNKNTSQEKFDKANLLMKDNLYEFAKDIWLDLVKADSMNANINYRTGFCLLNTSLQKKDALKYFYKAISNVDPWYNPHEYTIKTAPMEVYYYLGKSFHLNYKLDSAIKYFNLFLKKAGKKHYLRTKADHDLKQCDIAKNNLANPKNYVLTNIGPQINSAYSEYSPVLTIDESALFFTSRRLRTDKKFITNKDIYNPSDGKHFEDVYVSYKNLKTNQWNTPELVAFSKSNSNQATISVTGDGQLLYIYRDDAGGNGDIYFSERNEMGFDKLTPLDVINSESWETHVTTSINGQTMYYVSDRDGGLGGRDIYRCVKLPNGAWSKSLNVGPPINTPFDEESPFLHPDGKTLYYSSNSKESMGGFDIFFSQIQNDGQWSFPINMGYPLNTVEDDLYFPISADGKRGFYASSHEGGYGEKDIYEITFESSESAPVAILKGYIDPGPNNEIPSGIVIWVTDITEGNDPLQYIPNKKNGSYVFSLIPCHEYLVEYMLKNKVFYETEFKLPCGLNYHEINKVIAIGGVSLETDSTFVETTEDNNSTNSSTQPSTTNNSNEKNQNTENNITDTENTYSPETRNAFERT